MNKRKSLISRELLEAPASTMSNFFQSRIQQDELLPQHIQNLLHRDGLDESRQELAMQLLAGWTLWWEGVGEKKFDPVNLFGKSSYNWLNEGASGAAIVKMFANQEVCNSIPQPKVLATHSGFSDGVYGLAKRSSYVRATMAYVANQKKTINWRDYVLLNWIHQHETDSPDELFQQMSNKEKRKLTTNSEPDAGLIAQVLTNWGWSYRLAMKKLQRDDK